MTLRHALTAAALVLCAAPAVAQPAADAWPPTIPDLRMAGPCLRYPGSPNMADLGQFLTVINTCESSVALTISLTPFGEPPVSRQVCVRQGGPQRVEICVAAGAPGACKSLVHMMPVAEGRC